MIFVFKGSISRLRFKKLLSKAIAESQEEMLDFPEVTTRDHLPEPAWRNIKLREDGTD